jgi:hypothetical protein
MLCFAPQARIALLEGERRSAENLKTDLMRRVKMLEFALRQERLVDLAIFLFQFLLANVRICYPISMPYLLN